jgi:hypothetical protein
MPGGGCLGAGIGVGAVPTRPAWYRRGPRALRLYPLEAIIVAMWPPGPLWPRWPLAGAILGGIAAPAAGSLAAGSPSSLVTLPATGLAGLVGLAVLIRLGRGRLVEPTAPGAVRRAGGLPPAFPLGGTFLPARSAGIALPWLLSVLGAFR